MALTRLDTRRIRCFSQGRRTLIAYDLDFRYFSTQRLLGQHNLKDNPHLKHRAAAYFYLCKSRQSAIFVFFPIFVTFHLRECPCHRRNFLQTARHFCLVSSVCTAHRRSLRSFDFDLWGCVGARGVVCAVFVLKRAGRLVD